MSTATFTKAPMSGEGGTPMRSLMERAGLGWVEFCEVLDIDSEDYAIGPDHWVEEMGYTRQEAETSLGL